MTPGAYRTAAAISATLRTASICFPNAKRTPPGL